MLTIIEPAVSNALTTLDAVMADIGEIGEDAYLSELILRASSTVENICGRRFGRETVRETHRRHGIGSTIVLSRFPVVEIVSVTIGGDLADPSTYLASAGILDRVGGRGWAGSGVMLIDYTAGYVLPGEEGANLPGDIERAVLVLVKSDFYGRGRDPSLRSEAVEALSTMTYFQHDALDSIMPMVAPYRVPVVG